jgi:hypothetical protein
MGGICVDDEAGGPGWRPGAPEGSLFFWTATKTIAPTTTAAVIINSENQNPAHHWLLTAAKGSRPGSFRWRGCEALNSKDTSSESNMGHLL